MHTWSLYDFRSCYMVFPCLELALALGCLTGLVMFACYNEDNPFQKQFISSRDQVSCSGCVLFGTDSTTYTGMETLHPLVRQSDSEFNV